MGKINEKGQIISYESSQLISELEQDIAEFGTDLFVEVVTFNHNGVKIYADYNFQEDNKPPFDDLRENESVEVVEATKLLEIYKKQNEIL